jgi:4,5-DOPA dioxygenase extradiol
MKRLPVAFVSDLGPFPAVDRSEYTDALEKLGLGLPAPKALLVMSGHWDAGRALAVSSSKRPGIEHDYSGFPEKYYQVDYPVPGAPDIALRAVELLKAAGFEAKGDPDHSLDHGAWVPLTRLFPKADVPTVQITVPSGWEPGRIVEIGRALAPLRAEGVLVVASGALIHNLRRMRFEQPDAPPDAWAAAFDAWLDERLSRGDIQGLTRYREEAPSSELAAPTTEHFDPLFFALGAADGDAPKDHYRRIRHGNALLRLITFG